MKKFRFQLVAALAACCSLGMVSCSNEEYLAVESSNTSVVEAPLMGIQESKTRSVDSQDSSTPIRGITTIGGGVNVWTGEKRITTYTKQKILMNGAMPMGATGVYICDVKEITAVTSANPNMIYRSVEDNDCGYISSTVSTSSPVIGTSAVENVGQNTFTLKTTCYRIISNAAGMQYPSNYWIPCPPEEALLKYKVYMLD